jgi:probable F420-dependent oxidoreductase
MADEGKAPPRLDLNALKARLGRTGVWLASLGTVPADKERQAARTIEDLGYRTLWFGETPNGREALTHATMLLCETDRIMVATGIANIYARDAVAAANAASGLVEKWPGRFVLGLGVSHAPMVSFRGHDPGRPLEAMRAYLDGMDSARFSPPLAEPAPRVLAALRTGMLLLARDRAHGAHPYFVPPEHTALARETLGPAPLLAPEQAVVLDTDPTSARATARDFAAVYLQLPNYVNNLRQLGWSEKDVSGGGSDALIDAVVPWGDPDTIAERVAAHHQAGADHVCVQPVAATLDQQVEHLRLLSRVLDL